MCDKDKGYKRISPTTVEIDGEQYVKDYTTSFNYDEPDTIFAKIKSVKDAEDYIYENTDKFLENALIRSAQSDAFNDLTALADVLNEGKERDENGFRYYVYHDKGEFFICEHTYSTRHVIYFASRKIAQYSILIARDSWAKFYDVK